MTHAKHMLAVEEESWFGLLIKGTHRDFVLFIHALALRLDTHHLAQQQFRCNPNKVIDHLDSPLFHAGDGAGSPFVEQRRRRVPIDGPAVKWPGYLCGIEGTEVIDALANDGLGNAINQTAIIERRAEAAQLCPRRAGAEIVEIDEGDPLARRSVLIDKEILQMQVTVEGGLGCVLLSGH